MMLGKFVNAENSNPADSSQSSIAGKVTWSTGEAGRKRASLEFQTRYSLHVHLNSFAKRFQLDDKSRLKDRKGWQKVSQIWHLWKAFILQSKKVNKAIFNPRQNRIPTFIWHDLFCSLNRWPKKLALSTTFLSTCAPNLEQAQWVLLLSGNRKKLHTFCWWWLSPIFIIFSLGWDEKLSRLKFHY